MWLCGNRHYRGNEAAFPNPNGCETQQIRKNFNFTGTNMRLICTLECKEGNTGKIRLKMHHRRYYQVPAGKGLGLKQKVFSTLDVLFPNFIS